MSARTVVARAMNIAIAQKALFTDSLLSEEWLHGAGYFHRRFARQPDRIADNGWLSEIHIFISLASWLQNSADT
jgi:hypothetical protein